MGLASGFVRVPRPSGLRATLPWRVEFHDLHLVDRPSHAVGEHLHRDHELLLLRSGTWRGRIDGIAVAAAAPALIAIGPGQTHVDDCPGPVRMTAVHIGLFPGPSEDRSAGLLRPGAHPVLALPAAAADELAERCRAIAAAAARPGPTAGAVLDGLATALLWHWVGMLPAEAIADEVRGCLDADAFAGRLHALFERHLRANLGLSTMAAALGMPARTLTWRCRRLFGHPPTRLFQRHRLRAAREALVGSDLPVAAVAEHFGFASAAHFATAFRRVFGHPPSGQRRPPPLP